MTLTVNGKTVITGKTVIGPPPTPDPTPSITPTNTPTPSVTPTLTPTPSVTPTYTPTPSGVSSDVTPNPTPDWSNVVYFESLDDGPMGVQQIQGINTTITLNVSWTTSLGGEGRIYYKVVNTTSYTNGQIFNHGSLDFGTFTQLTNSAGSTFSVSNNQYVLFVCYINTPGSIGNGTVTVKNQSDGNVVLDTFTWRVQFD